LTSSYYRGSHGVFLVYAIEQVSRDPCASLTLLRSDRESFDSLHSWFAELDTYASSDASLVFPIPRGASDKQLRSSSSWWATRRTRSRGKSPRKRRGSSQPRRTPATLKRPRNGSESASMIVSSLTVSSHLLTACSVREDARSDHQLARSSSGLGEGRPRPRRPDQHARRAKRAAAGRLGLRLLRPHEGRRPM
jgi:hypothetical protein